MPRKVDANELRWLGEEADGKRGDQHVVVWRRDDRDIERLTLAPVDDLKPGDEIASGIEVLTPFGGPGLQAGYTILIRSPDGEVVELPDADCVFVTQSALAKFVIPYYTRFRSTGKVDDMRRKYFAEGVVGVAHFPPSDDEGIYEELTEHGREALKVVEKGVPFLKKPMK